MSHSQKEGAVYMLKYTIKRLGQLVIMLLVLTIVVFYIVRFIPGDPASAMLGPSATHAQIMAERERLGLNEPLPVQYQKFMNELFHGNLGTSIQTRKPVAYELGRRFPYTIKLALGATIVASFFGILFGIISAVRHNKFADNAIMVTSLISVSMPSFFFALLLMIFFSIWLKWLPTIGLDSWKHYILPIITLSFPTVGYLARTTRSSMLDVINQDYIRTSRARGIPNRVIIFSHAFKNALIPVLTAVGMYFGGLLAGATLTETVFSINGIGRFLVTSVQQRDYPAIQGSILVLATIFALTNTIVDLLYGLVDPRIKYD